MVVISVINMKGGVAKTTLAVNIADCLCRRHSSKVLLVDIDPQFNATQCLMSGDDYIEHLQNGCDTITHLFDRNIRQNPSVVNGNTAQEPRNLDDISPVAIKSNFELLPGSLELYRTEMATGEGREHRLRNFLAKRRDIYDFVIVDTPPTPSVWMTSALLASDFYLVPVKADPISLTGIDLLRSIVTEKIDNFGMEVECAGLVLTIVEQQTIVYKSAVDNLSRNQYWADKVFTGRFPKRTIVARQQLNQQFILDSADSELISSLTGITNELVSRIN